MSRKPDIIIEKTPNYIFKEVVTSNENTFINKQSSTSQSHSVLYNINEYSL